jgi:chromosome segregation ATPase
MMVSLEQIKQLESRVTKTIDYVKKVTEENKRLKEKLNSYQARIDELEVLVVKFKEDQSLIEDGILSALDRLNQFEDAVGSLLTEAAEQGKGQGKSKEEKKDSGPIIVPEPAAEPTGRSSPPEPLKPNPVKIEEKSSETGELDIF